MKNPIKVAVPLKKHTRLALESVALLALMSLQAPVMASISAAACDELIGKFAPAPGTDEANIESSFEVVKNDDTGYTLFVSSVFSSEKIALVPSQEDTGIKNVVCALEGGTVGLMKVEPGPDKDIHESIDLSAYPLGRPRFFIAASSQGGGGVYPLYPIAEVDAFMATHPGH